MKKIIYIFCCLLIGSTLTAQVSTFDIYAGAKGSQPAEFTSFNGVVYFSANNPTYGRELWKTDGTAAGTFLVKDIYADVLGSNPQNLFVANNILYFTANDGINGNELWMTNGIVTKMVKDYVSGSGSSNAKVVSYYNGNTIVHFNDGSIDKIETLDGNWTLGVYSGSEEAEIEPSHFYQAPNGLLYFAGAFTNSNYELYSWDGTSSPQLIADIDSSANSSLPEYFLQWNDSLFYQANDGIHGKEMWKTDGGGNSSLWADMIPGPYGSESFPIMLFNNKLVWQGIVPDNSTGFVHSGLHLLYDFLPRDSAHLFSTHKYYKANPIEFNGNLYYTGYKLGTGKELYKWDGTNPPQLVFDYNTGTASSNPSDLFVYKNHLFFNATDATGKTNLVMYNGNTWGNVKDSTAGYSLHDFVDSDFWTGEDLDITNGGTSASKYIIGTVKDNNGNEEPGTFSHLSEERGHYNYDSRQCLDYWKIVVVQGSSDSLNIVTAWDFKTGNTFTAQLSDKNGKFNSPTNIGTMSSNKGGKMAVTYPTGIPQSENYRIRIVATNPADTSLPSNEKYTLLPANKLQTCCPINPTIDSIYGTYAITYTYWEIDSIGKAVSSFAPITINDTIVVAPDVTNNEMMTIKSVNQATGVFDVTQPRYNIDRTNLVVGGTQPAINNGNTYSGRLRPSPTLGMPYVPPYQVTPIIENPFGFGFSTVNVPDLTCGPIQLPSRGSVIVEPRNIGTFAINRYELQVRGSNRVR